MTARLPVVVTVAVVLASIGCGPAYTMNVQTVPNPFIRPRCHAVLDRVHDENIAADSDEMDPAEEGFRHAILDEHGALFALGGAADNTFTIRPTWTSWAAGQMMFRGGRRGEFPPQDPSIAVFDVDVLSPAGQLLDRFHIETDVVPDVLVSRTAAIRMRSALRKAGSAVSSYLNDRWSCAPH